MFALGKLIGTKQLRNVKAAMKEQSTMLWMISVNVKTISLIRSVIQNVLPVHHPITLTLNWSSVWAAWRENSSILRFSNVFAQQQVPSRRIALASAASYLNSSIILIRLARIAKRTMFTIPKISNVGDVLRINLSSLLTDAVLARIINILILALKIASYALMVEIITRIKISVSVLLKLLSILKLSASHAFYQIISTSKRKNAEIAQLIWFMILAHINVLYVHQKDRSLAIKNVLLALRINFITKLLSLVKNAVLDVSMMQQKINVFARIQPYSSMELFALHVIILAIMISMKTSARIVVRTRSIVSLERFVKPAPKPIPSSMAINVPHVLIKQSGTQLLGIVRPVKEEKFLLMVIANAHKRSNFGIRLTVLNV